MNDKNSPLAARRYASAVYAMVVCLFIYPIRLSIAG